MTLENPVLDVGTINTEKGYIAVLLILKQILKTIFKIIEHFNRFFL